MGRMERFEQNMLKLTEEELIFINNVTKGPAPFGVFLKYPAWKDTGKLEEELLGSLMEKGILDAGKKITGYGMIPLLLWEEYRNADRHLVLNQAVFAVLPDGRLTGVRKIGKDYYLTTGRGGELVFELLKQSPFLRGGEKEGEHYASRRLSYDEWGRRMREEDYQVLVAGSYAGYSPEKETAYYWNQEEGWQYDLNKGRERRLKPRQMRMRLLELFNVREGGTKDE